MIAAGLIITVPDRGEIVFTDPLSAVYDLAAYRFLFFSDTYCDSAIVSGIAYCISYEIGKYPVDLFFICRNRRVALNVQLKSETVLFRVK